MNMAKLSIKGLIESALNLGRTLDSDYAPLQQFFVVMEHCLKHGLKSKCRCAIAEELWKSHSVPQTHEIHQVLLTFGKSPHFKTVNTFHLTYMLAAPVVLYANSQPNLES